MTAKKKQTDEPNDGSLLKSEHFSIKTVKGYSEVSRYAKEFYIPDNELIELHELLSTWRKEHGTNK